VVVSVHSGRANCHPDKIGKIAGWIPQTPVVMDHMGLPDNLAEGVAQAQAHPNIVLGTTILRFHKRWGDDPDAVVPTEVKSAIDALGPRRIVLGSNYPEYRPIQVMNALRRLQLGEAAERLIFGENLGRIYGLS
jgi:predicted TIM-barrel fold metal-dependent hydrolase